MSYEKDRLDSFVTSASLATALAPYITSNSVSVAIAGLGLGAYVTSQSLSVAVATDALTVRGPASVSATLSAAAVTVAGRPVGAVLLGYLAGTNRTGATFSGSWSDFCVLEFQISMINGFGTGRAALASGGSDILAIAPSIAMSNGSFTTLRAMGTNGESQKMLFLSTWDNASGLRSSSPSVTANTSFVNQFSWSITGTASVMFAALYGYRAT